MDGFSARGPFRCIYANICVQNTNPSTSTSPSFLPVSSRHGQQTQRRHYRESTPQIQDADDGREELEQEQDRDQDYEKEDEQYEEQRPAQSHQLQRQRQVQQATPALLTLDMIFDMDVEAYAVSHFEQYESELKRWAECETEEWMRGADGVFCFLFSGFV